MGQQLNLSASVTAASKSSLLHNLAVQRCFPNFALLRQSLGMLDAASFGCSAHSVSAIAGNSFTLYGIPLCILCLQPTSVGFGKQSTRESTCFSLAVRCKTHGFVVLESLDLYLSTHEGHWQVSHRWESTRGIQFLAVRVPARTWFVQVCLGNLQISNQCSSILSIPFQ